MILLQALALLIFIYCVIRLLKWILKKIKYYKILPSVNFLHFWRYFVFRTKGTFTEYPVLAHLMNFLIGTCELFKNEELFCMWHCHKPFIFLTKPEAVEEMFNNSKLTDKSWLYSLGEFWVGKGLITSNGKKWKHHRKILNPVFHLEALKDFLPTFNEKSFQLVKMLETDIQKSCSNLPLYLNICAFDIICETAFGMDNKAQERKYSKFGQAVRRTMIGFMKRIINPLHLYDYVFFQTSNGREIVEDVKFMNNYSMSIIKENKKKMMANKGYYESNKKRKSLIEILLKHQIETMELTEEDILEEVNTFINAGHDTISYATRWTIYLLGLHKNVQSKVHEELDYIFGNDVTTPVTLDDVKDMTYLDCVIKESLRLYPAAPIFARNAETDTEIRGYPIPEGANVIVFIYQLHRNEKAFPNPEKFDPTRFLPENVANRHAYAFIPFSAGSRNCIGQRYAMLEMKVIIANILRSYTVKSLNFRDEVQASIEMTLKPGKPMRIKIRPRKNNHTVN